MKFWEWIIIGVVVGLSVGAVVLIAWYNKRGEKKENGKRAEEISVGGKVHAGYGYLSEREYKFFKTLKEVAVTMGYVALPKVRISSILTTKDDAIKSCPSFHQDVDFVLFTEYDFRPALIVDLYDNSFTDACLYELDPFVRKTIDAAFIPVLKQPVKEIYVAEELKVHLERAISQTSRSLGDRSDFYDINQGKKSDFYDIPRPGSRK